MDNFGYPDGDDDGYRPEGWSYEDEVSLLLQAEVDNEGADCMDRMKAGESKLCGSQVVSKVSHNGYEFHVVYKH